MKRNLILAMTLTVTGAVFTPAHADSWDKQTIFRFNQPVEVPGRVLTPGAYLFKLAQSDANRNIVQIYTKDGDRLIATVLALPDYRLESTPHSVLTFSERVGNQPEAIHEWFYPNANEGVEFLYPKTAKPVAQSAIGAQAASAEQTAAQQLPAELPHTASYVPLIASLGIAAIGAGAIFLRLSRKHRS